MPFVCFLTLDPRFQRSPHHYKFSKSAKLPQDARFHPLTHPSPPPPTLNTSNDAYRNQSDIGPSCAGFPGLPRNPQSPRVGLCPSVLSYAAQLLGNLHRTLVGHARDLVAHFLTIPSLQPAEDVEGNINVIPAPSTPGPTRFSDVPPQPMHTTESGVSPMLSDTAVEPPPDTPNEDQASDEKSASPSSLYVSRTPFSHYKR